MRFRKESKIIINGHNDYKLFNREKSIINN